MKTKKLLMMCLLVVAVICACTVRVNALEEYQDSTATIFDEGGDYSIGYILSHFNHFVKEDATAGHTIGAIAVGGKANYIAGCGTDQGYNHTTSSYLKGPIIKVGSDGYFKRLYVGETELRNAQKFEHQNEQNTFISKNDCYIDFDKAFDEITAEAKTYQGEIQITYNDLLAAQALSPWNGKVNSLETNYWEMINEGSSIALKLKSGYSYKFENDVLKNIARIDLMDSDSKNDDTLLIADDQDSTTIPYIYLNGNPDEMSGEWGDGMSAVYILPYASEVKPFSKSQKHIGHIVAPNAYVHDMNGDVNGCFIAKTLDLTGSESHMFPYHGQKIKNNTTPIQPGGDSQDGNENPGENNPGTGSGETPNNPSQGDTGDNNSDTGNNDSSNNPKPGNATNPQPGQNNDNNGNTSNEEPKENNPKTEDGNTMNISKPETNDSKNLSTNNEIISNKEELTTNISRTLNTPKISSNKNNKVIVENNKQTNVKQKDSVKTGDDTHLLMYILLELLAFIGIVSLRKKA